MNFPTVSAAHVRLLMRRHKVTIRDVAGVYGLTLKRVREVRTVGGPWDWPEIIKGTATRKYGGKTTERPGGSADDVQHC